MNDCPYCGQPAADIHEEVAHMNAAHPDIVAERLRAAGITGDDTVTTAGIEYLKTSAGIEPPRRDLLIEQTEKVERLRAESSRWERLARELEARPNMAAEVNRLRGLGDALADAADGATFHTNDEHADEQDQAALHLAIVAWRRDG